MRKGTTKVPGKEDILAQLEAQRAKQAEQLKVEARARQELEDMLLRIERHFKVNQRFPVYHSVLPAVTSYLQLNLKHEMSVQFIMGSAVNWAKMAAIIAYYALRLMMGLVRASQALRLLKAACAEAFLGCLYVYDSSFVCMTVPLCA